MHSTVYRERIHWVDYLSFSERETTFGTACLLPCTLSPFRIYKESYLLSEENSSHYWHGRQNIWQDCFPFKWIHSSKSNPSAAWFALHQIILTFVFITLRFILFGSRVSRPYVITGTHVRIRIVYWWHINWHTFTRDIHSPGNVVHSVFVV